MIVVIVKKISSEASLSPYYISWSVAVSGECCPRTFQNGRQYTGTYPDEIKTVVLNSVLIKLS